VKKKYYDEIPDGLRSTGDAQIEKAKTRTLRLTIVIGKADVTAQLYLKYKHKEIKTEKHP